MNQEDRELLEQAAKAAGIKHVNYDGVDYDGSHGLMIVGEHGQHLHGWNPLADDGDALRLMVALCMDVNFYPACGEVEVVRESQCVSRADFKRGDGSKNLRYAIVMSAAEIGKYIT